MAGKEQEKGGRSERGAEGGREVLAFQQDEKRNIVCELGFSIRSAGMRQK